MKNILVTGGAGFIGSHTVVELAKAGYNPVIIDNLCNSEASVLVNLGKIIGKPVTFYEHDFQDKDFLDDVIKKETITGVIHFAAFKSVGESVKNPMKYFENNVDGLISLIGVLQTNNVQDLVFSSSCTVYGEPDSLPVDESAPIKPAESPYGATKQIGEMIIKDATAASNSLRSVSLRYFNPIGAHESALIGELPKGDPENLVPRIARSVAGLLPPITVFGNDYKTADGTCVRDYIHVQDLADAHVKALTYLEDKSAGFFDVFNIGMGVGISVMELITTFEEATEQKVNYEIGPRRDGDVEATYASVKKANEVLNWHATKSLEVALSDAWRWQQTL